MGTTTHDAPHNVLVCLCGQCAHWEIVANPLPGINVQNMDPVPIKLRCMTCKKEFDARMEIAGQTAGLNVKEHLAWEPPKEIKVE